MTKPTYEDLENNVKELQKLVFESNQIKNTNDGFAQSLDLMINTVPDIIYRLDSKGKIVFINKSVIALGYSSSELIGKSILEIVHPDDREKATYRINERRCGERGTKRYELRLLSKDALSVQFEDKSIGMDEPVFLVDAEGFYEAESPSSGNEFLGTLGVARDITERKKLQEKIEYNLSLLESTMHSTADGILVVNTEDKVSFYNDRFIQLWSITEDVIEKNDDRALLDSVLDQLVNQNEFIEKVHYLYGHPDEISDDLLFFKDGKVFERHSRPQKINGEIVGRVWNFKDVTSKRKADEDLKKSRENLSVTLNSIGEGVIATDVQGRITLMNPIAEKLTGWKYKQSKEKQIQKIFNIVNLNTNEIAENPVDRVLEDGIIFGPAYHNELISKDGFRYQIAESAAPIKKDDGTIIGVIIVFRDVSKRYSMEKKVEEQRSFLRQVMDIIPHFVFVKDRQGRFSFVNQSVADSFSTSIKNLIGKTEADFNPDLKKAEQYQQQNLEVMNFKKELVIPDNVEILPSGKTLHKHTIKRPFIDREGNANQIVVVSSDITEQKKAEKVQKVLHNILDATMQAETLEKLLENIHAEINELMDAKNFYVALYNKITDTYTFPYYTDEHDQIDPTEQITLGKGLTEYVRRIKEPSFFTQEDIKKLDDLGEIELIGTAAKSWMGVPLLQDGEPFGIVVVQCYSNSDTYNKDNLNILSYISGQIAMAIEQKQAEEELIKSEFFLTKSQRVANLGSYNLNMQKGLWTSSEVLDDIFGIDENFIRDVNSWAQSIHPDDRKEMLEYFHDEVYGMKSRFDKEYRIINRETNEVKWVHGLGELQMNDEGDVIGMIGTIQDITDRKYAEQERKILEEQLFQAQKMESIGVLAGGIAHDFNNILAISMGYADLLRCQFTDLNTTEGNAADIIFQSAKRASKLTQQLLGFARKGHFNKTSVYVNEIIKETLRVSEKIFEKQVEVECDFEKKIKLVNADKNQLDQVLTNIFINAKDAMPKGGKLNIVTENIDITKNIAKTKPELKVGPYVKISITDNGTGISKDVLDKIFEPFFTTKADGKGTGLGLASTYGIIKNHEGFIYCESELGVGTTFYIYLPASKITIREKIRDTKVIHGASTILIVDDEEDFVRITKRSLEYLEYTVMTACNGDEAIEIYKSNQDKIDLILLDMIMPGKTGRETFYELKKLNPKVRVLLSSGYGKDGYASEILREGVLGFIQKPFSLQDLSNEISKVLTI